MPKINTLKKFLGENKMTAEEFTKLLRQDVMRNFEDEQMAGIEPHETYFVIKTGDGSKFRANSTRGGHGAAAYNSRRRNWHFAGA